MLLQRMMEESQLPYTIRLSPSIPAMAQALIQLFIHFRWKTAAVIAIGDELLFLYVCLILLSNFFYIL